MNNNGILIQCINEPTNYVSEFNYSGINAFHLNPLIRFNDIESKSLTNAQQNIRFFDNQIICSDLITNQDLYDRYIGKCKKLHLPIRLLFIKSSYTKDIWHDELPKMDFIGYEYCPFPIDEQIITDINWYKPFFKYHSMLNKYGLFSSYEEIDCFAKEYDYEFFNGNIGDGEIDSYICEVFLLSDSIR